MLKRLAVIAAFFTIAIAAVTASVADEQKLLRLLPPQPTALISLDAEEWLSLPKVSKHLHEDEQVVDFRKKTGLQLTDLGAVSAWFRESDGMWTLLLAWKKPFDWKKVFASADKKVFTAIKIAGYDAWQVNADIPQDAVKTPISVRKLSFVITALAPDILCITENVQDTGVLLPLLGKGKGVRFSPKLKGSFRGFYKSSTPVPGMPRGGEVALGFTGQKKKDLYGLLVVECGSQEEARQLNAQTVMMVNMGLGMGMPDNPELAGELIRCIKFSAAGKTFSININIPEKLLNAAVDYAAKKADSIPAGKKAPQRKNKN